MFILFLGFGSSPYICCKFVARISDVFSGTTSRWHLEVAQQFCLTLGHHSFYNDTPPTGALAEL